MADTQETAREIVSRHAQGIADKRVFIHPGIPPEKLKAALDSYGEGIAGEDVLVLFDLMAGKPVLAAAADTVVGWFDSLTSTLLGDKNLKTPSAAGALLTADSLRSRTRNGELRSVDLNSECAVSFSGKPPLALLALLVNGSPLLRCAPDEEWVMEQFADMLRDVALASFPKPPLRIVAPKTPPSMPAVSETPVRKAVVHMASPTEGNDSETTTETSVLEEKTVSEWLDSIGMEQHDKLFREQRVELSHLRDLTDADLREMGVDALGDRRTILDSVKMLHKQEEQAAEKEAVSDLQSRAGSFNAGCCVIGLILLLVCAVVGVLAGGLEGLWALPLVGAVGMVALYMYLLPSAIAFRNGHGHRWMILIVNLFFGVTVVVWVVLLCHAMGLFGFGLPPVPENPLKQD